jgi:DNA-binding response OmpR family regulator
MPESRDRFIAMGMDAYMAKPVDMHELGELLDGLFAQRPSVAGC